MPPFPRSVSLFFPLPKRVDILSTASARPLQSGRLPSLGRPLFSFFASPGFPTVICLLGGRLPSGRRFSSGRPILLSHRPAHPPSLEPTRRVHVVRTLSRERATQTCRIDREMQAGGPKTTRNYASEWETSAHTALMALRTRPLGRKHLHDGGSAHVELLHAGVVHHEQRRRGHHA